MLSKADALDLVLKRLQEMSSPTEPFVVNERATLEKPYGWVFFYNSKLFMETGNPLNGLAGNGPVIVNKNDGTIEFLGSAQSAEKIVAEYERKLG